MTIASLKNTSHSTYAYKSMDKNSTFLRAIIFDCDGVLVDSEPLHFAALNKIVSEFGEPLSEEAYKADYLAFDDKGAITEYFKRIGKELKTSDLESLMVKKTQIFQDMLVSEGLLPYPAVPEFVMSVSQRYPLAVASGARRHELDLILESAGIRPYFELIISSDDVSQGKPHPESFLKALEGLNNNGKRPMPIRPEECLVIEDSIQGVSSAHRAGMKCIAVATSFPAFELKEADLVVPSLSALRVSQCEDLFATPSPKPAPLPAVPHSN